MKTPDYSLQRWKHGWSLSGTSRGIPIRALSETTPLLEEGALLFPGIAHHLNASGHPNVVVAMASPADGEAWCQEIEEELKDKPPQERWWRGTHVGTSSASIFAVFCDPQWAQAAKNMGQGSTPKDAADLQRCHRLLKSIPEWESRLQEVAAAYPNTNWPKIIESWEDLKKKGPEEQCRFLRELEKEDCPKKWRGV